MNKFLVISLRQCAVECIESRQRQTTSTKVPKSTNLNREKATTMALNQLPFIDIFGHRFTAQKSALPTAAMTTSVLFGGGRKTGSHRTTSPAQTTTLKTTTEMFYYDYETETSLCFWFHLARYRNLIRLKYNSGSIHFLRFLPNSKFITKRVTMNSVFMIKN